MPQLEVYRVDRAQVDEASHTAEVTGDEAHHLLRVRRARPGERLMLIDGLGAAWTAELREQDGRRVVCALGERFDNWREPPLRLHLGLGTLKGDHWLDALDGCVQAGVGELTPLLCERSVAAWPDNRAERARRRALEAAKQCGRGLVPPVHPAQRLADWCIQIERIALEEPEAGANPVHRFVAEPDGQAVPVLQAGEMAAVAIGPEGGFTDSELTLLDEHGFIRIGLGARRFRAETAAVIAVARLISPAET